MKSIILTIFMFIVIFASLYLGIIEVISSDIFAYLTYGIFLTVIACGLYFVGFPKKQTAKTNSLPTEQSESKKEENHEDL